MTDKPDSGTWIDDLMEVDRVVHEPARLAILAILYVAKSADFVFLQRETALTRGNLSSHLSKLEEAGYIQIEKGFDGKIPRTTCQMTQKGQAAFRAYLERMRGVLGAFD